MPTYIIPILIAMIVTIITVGMGVLIIHSIFGEVDLEDVKLLILLCALFFGLPAVIGFAVLI